MDEIRCVLHVFPQFDDVYSSDTLPSRPCGLLVCNLDPSNRPGMHCLAIYVDDNYGVYVDSIGTAPPDVIQNYLNRWCRGADKWIYNKRELQSVIS